MPPQHPADDSLLITAGVLAGLPVASDQGGDGKEGRGTILVIGGTAATPGAAVLAGVTALRAGAGKLQLAVAASVAAHVAVAVPECACVSLPQTAAGEIDPIAAEALAQALDGADAVLIGPGLVGPDTVPPFVERVLAQLTGDQVVVVDAKAVQSLRPSMTAHLAGRLILTPNQGEAAELVDDDALVDKDPLTAARRLAEQFDAVVALRGATSWVTAPDGSAYRNEAGNEGLGTSGSGDVCSGLLAGLAARGAAPLAAAVWGVHAHARAGDRLALRIGATGFLAREIADEIPAVLTELESGDSR
ncbi:MAG TPA: NAD(P)H-hydrate dehydratase [Mycobacteriales bacterium]|jgi:hydroxyethylthiazole kinase-like uncharacterized protein yjeF|nr:NAD(P)H-hydrate dehydratase [Mycobacteriales bacterium]